MDLQNAKKWDEPNLPLIPVGLVGIGPALEVLVSVLHRNDLSLFFPQVRICGWSVAFKSEAAKEELALPPVLRDVPLFDEPAELFAAKPDLMVVADLTPDSDYMPVSRGLAGNKVSLISSDMVLRFCSLVSEGRLHLSEATAPPRNSQKLFSLLVDQVKGDMLILDDQCNILDANVHAAQSLGMSVSQIIGLNCKELGAATEFCICDEASCPYLQARAMGKQAVRTHSLVTSEGRVRYMESACYPITGSTNGKVLYLYIRRDVTEQRHLEQRLQQSEKMAAIGELSTYMAHEIRNPLFAIGGFANALLRNPSLGEVAQGKARIIYDESRRLDLIVTKILNFARPTDQTMDEFDVEAVARQTIDLMTMGSDERGIAYEINIQEGLPKALGNAENLKQCLVNIVKNALEAMPDGGRLGLRAARADNFIRVDVTDTGDGIKPEVRDQIFNPFFSTKHDGSGLGLAMTRKVIGEMGGKVTLESLPGKGTTISLFVPVAMAVNGPAAEPQAKPEHMASSPDPRTVIVLATRNKGKIRELETLLKPFSLRVAGLDEFPAVGEVEENGSTFAENALLKACTVSKATGFVTVADDSGLEVDALDGAPGVYSARYSETPAEAATDERNLRKVLDAIRDVPATERTARFRCCMAACTPGGESILAEGAWEGILALEPAGHNGFGYDPVFFDPEKQCTAAQMSAEEKNSRSHRAKAVAALLDKWPSFWRKWTGQDLA